LRSRCSGSGGSRVRGAGCRVQGSDFRVQGSGFRVRGSGVKFKCLRDHVVPSISVLMIDAIANRSGLACRERERDLIRKNSFKFKTSGNEVYYTNSLTFLIKMMLCSNLHCQKFSKLKVFSYKIFIDNLLVRVHLVIEMSRPDLHHGSLNSLFQVALYLPSYAGTSLSSHQVWISPFNSSGLGLPSQVIRRGTLYGTAPYGASGTLVARLHTRKGCLFWTRNGVGPGSGPNP
jgi:hypothetical protein